MTTDYKTVFQLAQDKGYNPEYRIDLSPKEQMSQFAEHYPDECRYIDLCLIQKWLIDEQGVHVNITPSLTQRSIEYMLRWSRGDVWIYSDTEFYPSYESALLEGIHEGLKLI